MTIEMQTSAWQIAALLGFTLNFIPEETRYDCFPLVWNNTEKRQTRPRGDEEEIQWAGKNRNKDRVLFEIVFYLSVSYESNIMANNSDINIFSPAFLRLKIGKTALIEIRKSARLI